MAPKLRISVDTEVRVRIDKPQPSDPQSLVSLLYLQLLQSVTAIFERGCAISVPSIGKDALFSSKKLFKHLGIFHCRGILGRDADHDASLEEREERVPDLFESRVANARLFLDHLVDHDDKKNDHQYADHPINPTPSAHPVCHPTAGMIHRSAPFVTSFNKA